MSAPASIRTHPINKDEQVRERLDYMFVSHFGTNPARDAGFDIPALTYVDPETNEVTDLSDHLAIVGMTNRNP